MINYGWSPCQEGVKQTPLLIITPRAPGVLSVRALRHRGGLLGGDRSWGGGSACGAVRAGLCTVLDGDVSVGELW